MIDAFGVEISKSGVGAGRYMRAVDMPKKVRTRQLERLRAGKPQVASIQDQTFNFTRSNPELTDFSSVLPKTKGTAIQTGRKKRTAQLHNVGENNIGPYAAVTVPNPRKNTNHILMPDKSKTKGVQGFLLEHEKTHAQLKPKRLAQAQFRTSRQRLGEEARADATATLKTGRKRNPSSYVLAGNKHYDKVYTNIVGRKPKYGMSGRDLKQIDPPDFVGSKNEIRRIYRGSAKVMNGSSYKRRTGPLIQEGFTRRAPGPNWLDGSTPYRYNRKPNLP